MESKDEDLVPKQDVKPDTPQVYKESEKQDNLGESVRFYDNENKENRICPTMTIIHSFPQ